jgi:hypothetical protein
MTHPFFDELRNPETRLANGKELPNLFDFSVHGKFSKRHVYVCSSTGTNGLDALNYRIVV